MRGIKPVRALRGNYNMAETYIRSTCTPYVKP